MAICSRTFWPAKFGSILTSMMITPTYTHPFLLVSAVTQRSLPTASRSLDAALMKTLHRKLSNKSDGSEGEPAKLPEKEPSGGSIEKAGSDKGSGKPPTGKGETDLEEVREKFRIVKVKSLLLFLTPLWFTYPEHISVH